MRCAAVDATTGEPANLYPLLHATASPTVPSSPWAVPLATREGHFTLLGFDLDAKTHLEPGAAADAAGRDTCKLASLLTDCGIDHVICASGPSGGRHVWVGLVAPVSAQTVAALARDLRLLLATLDIAPLANPATGCLRPPGAPHRAGGSSTVLAGDLNALTCPQTTPEQVRALHRVVIDRVSAAGQDSATLPAGSTGAPAAELLPRPNASRIVTDAAGHSHLPGARQLLPAASQAALRTGRRDPFTAESSAGLLGEAASRDEDASAVLWHVLIGAASAHWQYQDVAGVLTDPDTPGLEHARTFRKAPPAATRGTPPGAARSPRPRRGPASSRRVLERQWERAVAWVATHPRADGLDETFPARAAAITDHVLAVQIRADASPGRWTRGGGPADRRVLDGLALLCLQAVQPSVEADIRRLSMLVGLGREATRTALHRLADDGWITQAAPAAGVRGAIWHLTDPRLAARIQPGQVDIHRNSMLAGHKRSRAPQPPVPGRVTGPAERASAVAVLTARLDLARDDVFTPGSLGLAAGNLLARVYAPAAWELGDYAGALRSDLSATSRKRLDDDDLLTTPSSSRRAGYLRRVAVEDDVLGRLTLREAAYVIERELWAWWCAEREWMVASRSAQRARPGHEQVPLWADPARDSEHRLRRHPRRADGRACYRSARARLTTGSQR